MLPAAPLLAPAEELPAERASRLRLLVFLDEDALRHPTEDDHRQEHQGEEQREPEELGSAQITERTTLGARD